MESIMVVIIRPEKENDREYIYKVNELAFGRDVESRLVDSLRSSKSYVEGLSLVAEHVGEIVGHIMFTRISTDPGNEKFLGVSLAPVAVLPDYQNQGIGSKLIREGIKACKSRSFEAIIVIGHPEYYPKFGFTQARGKGLESSIPVPDEAFMVLELVPGSLEGMEGKIIFASEFDEFI
jgi:putative acetyltransferase